MPKKLDYIEIGNADRTGFVSTVNGQSIVGSLKSNPSFDDRLGRPAEVTLSFFAGSEIAINDDTYLQRRRVVRLYYDDASFSEWRITDEKREVSGEKDVTVNLEPMWLDLGSQRIRKTLSTGVSMLNIPFYAQTVDELLTLILGSTMNAPSLFTKGSVDPDLADIEVSVLSNNNTHLEVLSKLCEIIGAEWDVTYNGGTDKYEVNLYEKNGVGSGTAGASTRPVQMGNGIGNRISLERVRSDGDFFSRLVPVGGTDNNTFGIGGTIWNVESAVYDGTTNTTITLKERVIVEDGFLDAFYFGDAGIGIYDIVSTTAPNQIVVSGDASGLSGGQGEFMRDGAGTELEYLEDETAVSEVGIVEKDYRRTDITPYSNLIDDHGITDDFSDWASGEPEGVNLVGGASVVQETGELIQFGGMGAKISGDTDDGIETIDINLSPSTDRPYFSMTVAVRMISGAIKFELIDSAGTVHPVGEIAKTTSTETRELQVGGFEPASGNAKLRIIFLNDTAEAVLDAWTLTQSPSPYSYTENMGKRALFLDASRELTGSSGLAPDIFKVKAWDMSFIDDVTYDEITVGDWVRVRDNWNEVTDTWGIDFDARVVRVKYLETKHGRIQKDMDLSREEQQLGAFLSNQYLSTSGSQSQPSIEIAKREFQDIEVNWDGIDVTGQDILDLLLTVDGYNSGLVAEDSKLWEGNAWSDYMNQAVRSTDSPTFVGMNLDTLLVNAGAFVGAEIMRVNGDVRIDGDLDIGGTVNYINEQNLQVEDRTITVNKNGTDPSAVGGGLILERPSGNRSILWDTDGWTMDDRINAVGGVFSGNVESDTFSLTTDFNGAGYQATPDGDFNVRNLVVRQSARFRELIIDQLSAIGGSTILSGARGKIESVSGNDVTLEDPNGTGVTQFTVGSLFVVREVDVDGSEFKFVAGIVTAVSGMTITLSNADVDLPAEDSGGAWGSIGSLSAGDVIVERGHTSTASRQNVIYESATDSDSPVTKYLSGIDSLSAFSDDGNIVAQIGNLSSITDTINGQAVNGFGFYSDNAFLKGGIVATYGAVGGFNIGATTITGGNLTLSSNGIIGIGGVAWQGSGIQLDYNSGSPRFYVGDGGVTGSDRYFMFDGTNLSFNAGNTSLSTSGNLTATNVDLTGTITATSGDIGGWDIAVDNFSNVDGNGGMVFSTSGTTPTFVMYSDNEVTDVLTITLSTTLPSVGAGDTTFNPTAISFTFGTAVNTDPSSQLMTGTNDSSNVTGFNDQKITVVEFDVDGDTNNPAGGDFDYEVRVQVSNDASTWTTVATVSGDETTVPETHKLNIENIGYTYIQLEGYAEGVCVQGQSIDVDVTNATFKQYITKVAINPNGIFQTVAPSTYLSLASSSGGFSSGGGGGTVTWSTISGKPSTESEWATETSFDNRYLQSLPAHNHNGLYYTESEIGNFFDGTTAMTGYNKSNWDTAFGWGNHATAGYLTSESDPTVPSHVKNITSGNITNWNSAYTHSNTTTGNPHNIGMSDISDFGTYFEDTYFPSLADYSSHGIDNLDEIFIRNASGNDMRTTDMLSFKTYLNNTLAFNNYTWTLRADTGSDDIIQSSSIVDISGGTGIATSISGQVVTIALSGSINADTLDGLDSTAFLQGNETITLSGDITGSGSTSISTSISSGAVGVNEIQSQFVRLHGAISGSVQGTDEILISDASNSYSNKKITVNELETFMENNLPFASSSHNHNSLYYTESEIGNFFNGTTSMTGYNKSNWDSAYSWGDHGSQGYVTANSSPTFSTLTLSTRLNHNNTPSRDKIRVWSSSNYTIGMESPMTYGALSDYAMTFQMNSASDRGWWWGDSSHDNTDGAMSLTTTGILTLASRMRIGFGEGDTTTMSSSYDLQLSGNGIANDFITTSDRRVKSGEEVIHGALETIRNINAYTYKKNGKDSIGYIAQEVEKFTKNVVFKEELNGYKDFRSMNLFGMQAYNTMAIKELDKSFMDLEKRVKELEEKVRDLGGTP